MFLILAIAILAVSILDVGYSAWAIKRYGLTEGNPMWAWIAASPLWFMVVSIVVHTVILAGLYAIRCPAWALGIGLFVRVMVCVRNVNVVKGRIRRKA